MSGPSGVGASSVPVYGMYCPPTYCPPLQSSLDAALQQAKRSSQAAAAAAAAASALAELSGEERVFDDNSNLAAAAAQRHYHAQRGTSNQSNSGSSLTGSPIRLGMPRPDSRAFDQDPATLLTRKMRGITVGRQSLHSPVPSDDPSPFRTPPRQVIKATNGASTLGVQMSDSP